ncbi:hypothetical protein HG531_004669 [Fusarium graminearum]|nr:hypothetical protein HG531_004669 [Fusarium graminearum]
MEHSTVVKTRVRSVLGSGLGELLALGVEILHGVLGVSKNVGLALHDEHGSSELVRTSTVEALLPVNHGGVLDPAGVLVQFLDSQVTVKRTSGGEAALVGERNAAHDNVGGVILDLDFRIQARERLKEENGNNISGGTVTGTAERLGNKLDGLERGGHGDSTEESTSSLALHGLSLVSAPSSHTTLAVTDDNPFLGDLVTESLASSLKTETDISGVKSTGLVHEALRNITTLTSVIRSNDDVSLENKLKGGLPLVVQTAVVGRGALSGSACCSMGPHESAERLVVSKRVGVRNHDKSSSWDRLSVDILCHVEVSVQGDTSRNSPSPGGLNRWDFLPLDKVTGGIVRHVGGVGVKRVCRDILVDPKIALTGQSLAICELTGCVASIRLIGVGKSLLLGCESTREEGTDENLGQHGEECQRWSESVLMV